MNLRLPVVICIVGAAGAAAIARSVHPPASAAPAVAFSQEDASAPARRTIAPRAASTADANVVVYVAGAVARGGVYRVPSRSRAVDALRAAGGATSAADLVAVNLAAPLADGDEVIVPEKGAPDDANAGGSASETSASAHHKKRKRHRKKGHKRKHRRTVRSAAASTGDSATETADDTSTIGDAAPAAPIDINSADASVLETLPGVGTKLAERIVTYRELNGPFTAHDDLLDVGGMTQKRLDDIEPFLLPL